MSDHSAELEQFKAITNASDQVATFFLESHKWNLEEATSAFFENGGSIASNIPSSSAANPTSSTSGSTNPSQRTNLSRLADMIGDDDDDDKPYRRPPPPQSLASFNAPPPSSSSRPNKSSSKKPAARVGGIRTFADLNRDDDDDHEGHDHGDDDDDEDKTMNYFTGGEKSGLMVQSAPKQKKSNDDGDAVNDVFQSAVRQGAKPAHEVQKEKDSFDTSAGYMLGSGGSSQQPTTVKPPTREKVEEVRITFWAQGFTVNDGPLRRIDDPANQDFLNSIQRGIVPAELEKTTRGGTARDGLSIHLIDNRSKEYTEPVKPKYVAYSGSGQALGSTPSTTSTTSTSSTSTTSTTSNLPARPTVDTTQPTTQIQIRMADGSRQQATFNESHTVGHLLSFINSITNNNNPYDLLTGFPQRPIKIDRDQTLKDAGLCGEALLQKYK